MILKSNAESLVDCSREDCRLHFGMGSTTCMYYPPIYDKKGNNLNPDMNTTTHDVDCFTCKRMWTISTQNHEIVSRKEVFN